MKAETPTRSRFLRYSLRGLLGVNLLCCLVLAWFAWQMRELRQQQAIARELEELGCGVTWNMYYFPNEHRTRDVPPDTPPWLVKLLGGDPNEQLTRVFWPGEEPGILPEFLQAVERLPHLRILSLDLGGDVQPIELHRLPDLEVITLYAVRVPAATLDEIGEIRGLRSLGIAYSEIRDDELARLEGLTQLTQLDLESDERLTSQCLLTVCKFASLRDLNLSDSAVDNTNLRLLERLPELNDLNLSRTRINDDGLESLSQCNNLEKLFVGNTQIKGPGLAFLAALPKLTGLSLAHTEITDECIESLLQCRHLEWLNLTGTALTPQGITKLKQAFPKLQIHGP